MKNYLIIFFILIIAITICTFTPVSYAEEDEEFVPVTYLDTEAKYDIPDAWIYEGVLYNKDYSQKKYTNINNLNVSILYGMRNLKDEIKKKMPFIPAESILSSLSEESLVNILGSASNSTIEEKVYGDNKFYEFLKTQKTDNGSTVNCIVDMMVEGDNIYSFSYVFKDERFAINDYGKVLTSFKIANKQIENTIETEATGTNVEPEIIEEKIEPIVEKVEEVKEEKEIINEEVKEESKETIKEEIEEEPKIETIEEEEASNIVEIQPSGNVEELPIVEEIIPEEENIDEQEEIELNFEDMGVVQNTYKPKSWIESVGLIFLNNPILLVGIIILVILEILFWRFIKKRRKNKSK